MDDWNSEAIIAAIYAKRITLRALDRRASLAIGTVSATLHKPNARGEAAIANLLRVAPNTIWPSRYNPDGTRRKPQPAANYSPAKRFSEILA